MGARKRCLLLAGALLFAVSLFGTASAQQWYGTGALTLSGGSQTNLYLDPVLNTWNPDVDAAFGAVTPRAGLTYDTDRVRLSLMTRARVHPRRRENPQLSQGQVLARVRLTSEWSLGAVGGAQRYRFFTRQTERTTARDSWWALPSLRWTPTSETMLTLRAGLTQRFERSFARTDRQTSGLASLRVTHWLTNRLQGRVRAYFSDGTTSIANTDFGSVGGSAGLTYWPSSSVSIEGTLTFEQPRFDTLRVTGGLGNPEITPETVRDRIGRAGMEVEWRPRTFVSVFGRAEGLAASLEAGDSGTDLHVSAGVRFQVQRAVGSSPSDEPEIQPSGRRVCEGTEDGIRLRVPYDGPGTPHVTGDFNGWALPGIPLAPAEEDQWTTRLSLPPGQYEYRLRVVHDGDERWLGLPSYARTTDDTFGGTNGICIVP